MRDIRHPISGNLYGVSDDGRVMVTKGDEVGYFDENGRYLGGTVLNADPHLCCWLASGQRAQGVISHRLTGAGYQNAELSTTTTDERAEEKVS
jgi:hypothetical protein